MDPIEKEFAFGRFLLRPDQRVLLREGEIVPLGGRAFDLLEAMIEQSGHLMTREALMQRVWPGIFVHENNLAVHVSALRQALGRGDRQERYIATVPGRGYRFIAPVTIRMPRRNDRPEPPKPLQPAVELGNPRYPLSPLIGRDRELAVIAADFPAWRLVTILGPGGIGKTRLALGIADHFRSRLPGGVWTLDLTAQGDGGAIPADLARLVGAGQGDFPLDGIARHLAGRPFLVVLDNCEHVVRASARAAAALLERCPDASVLATSQQRLGLPEERVHRLQPLDVPNTPDGATIATLAAYSGCALFLERLRAADPRLVLTDAEAEAIAEIVARLDGLPLAIELAAARVPLLGIDGLRRGLDDRFTLLADRRRLGRPGHQTLRATLDLSVGLLTPVEQTNLMLLSVFAGGFTLEAGAAVAGADPLAGPAFFDSLVEFTERSLVQTRLDNGEPRYRLLETPRLYLLERLQRSDLARAARRAHAMWFADLLEVAEQVWETTETQSWIEALAPDLDNVRTALAWCFGAEGDARLGIRLVAVSHGLWRGVEAMGEGHGWFERAAASLPPDADHALAARIWTGVARMALSLAGRGDAALAAVAAAWAAGDAAILGRALMFRGEVERRRGQWAEAAATLEEATLLLRATDAEKSAAEATHQWSIVLERLGEAARSRALNADALIRFRAVGHGAGIIACLVREANLDLAAGAVDRAILATEEAIRLSRSAQNRYMIQLTLTNLASYRVIRGDIVEAEAAALEALPIARQVDDRIGVAIAVQHLAYAAWRQDRPEPAARLLGFSEAIFEAQNEARDDADAAAHRDLRAGLAALLGAEELAALTRIGALWNDDHVMAALGAAAVGGEK